MISFTNMDEGGSDAGNRAAMAEVGVTQAGVTASTQANRMAGAAAMEDKLDGTPLGKNPRMSLNPLGVGPVITPAFIQPGTGNPAAPGVSVQVEGKLNPLGINAPVAKYVQPGTSAPPAPVAGQLSAFSYGSLGVSKITNADGTTRST
jgi:hypothetical protein